MLVMGDARGTPRINLYLGEDGEPRFWLADGRERQRIVVGLIEGGVPGLVVADESGVHLWSAP